jgi:hypothetical protein
LAPEPVTGWNEINPDENKASPRPATRAIDAA